MLPPPQTAGLSFPAFLSLSLQQLFLNAPLCSCFFFLHCLLSPLVSPHLIFTAPVPQSLQAHLWFLRCFSVCPTSIWYQSTKFAAQTSPGNEFLQAASHILPAQRNFLGHSLRYFTGTCFPKPPFLLLSECEECLHYWTVGLSFLFPLPQLPSSHYTCRESSSSWGCLFFVRPACEWLDTKTLQYIKHFNKIAPALHQWVITPPSWTPTTKMGIQGSRYHDYAHRLGGSFVQEGGRES